MSVLNVKVVCLKTTFQRKSFAIKCTMSNAQGDLRCCKVHRHDVFLSRKKAVRVWNQFKYLSIPVGLNFNHSDVKLISLTYQPELSCLEIKDHRFVTFIILPVPTPLAVLFGGYGAIKKLACTLSTLVKWCWNHRFSCFY